MGMVDYVGRSRKRVITGDIPDWVLNRGISARYITSVILSAPPWVDRWELYALKHTAAALTRMTGVLHVLDHIVPLNHPDVCGPHGTLEFAHRALARQRVQGRQVES